MYCTCNTVKNSNLHPKPYSTSAATTTASSSASQHVSTYIVDDVLLHASASLERIRDLLFLWWCPLWQNNPRTPRQLPERCAGDRCRRHVRCSGKLAKSGLMQSALRPRAREDVLGTADSTARCKLHSRARKNVIVSP